MAATETFADLIEANRAYATRHQPSGMSGIARRRLAVVTCIDSRLDPLAILGLAPGDAKIVRNAGARISGDALRSLVIAVHLLGVERIVIMQHTDCRMTSFNDRELAAQIHATTGSDASGWDFGTFTDQTQVLSDDIALLRGCPLLPSHVAIQGFVYDITSGLLRDTEETLRAS